MNTFLTLSIIGASFFTIALIILIILYGIPSSLSESFYNLGGRNGKGYLFYLMLVITVLLLIAPLVEAAGGFGFATAAALAFVGAAAAFKDDKITKIVHISSAALSGLFSLITLFKMKELILVVPVIIGILLLAFFTKTIKSSRIFWIEMVAFYSIFVGLIVYFS